MQKVPYGGFSLNFDHYSYSFKHCIIPSFWYCSTNVKSAAISKSWADSMLKTRRIMIKIKWKTAVRYFLQLPFYMFSIRSNRKFTPYCHVSMSSYSRPTLFVSSGIILLSFPYSTSLTWFTIFQSNVETETFWCQPTPDNVQDHEYEVFRCGSISWTLPVGKAEHEFL